MLSATCPTCYNCAQEILVLVSLTHVCDGQERVRQELHAAGLVPTAQQPQPRDLQFAGAQALLTCTFAWSRSRACLLSPVFAVS